MISKEEKLKNSTHKNATTTISKLVEEDCVYYLKKQHTFLEHHLKVLEHLKEKVKRLNDDNS